MVPQRSARLRDRLKDKNRVIDAEILSQNISIHLVCRYCSGGVYLCEVHRKVLKSQFAFMCISKEYDMQKAFPSSAGITYRLLAS